MDLFCLPFIWLPLFASSSVSKRKALLWCLAFCVLLFLLASTFVVNVIKGGKNVPLGLNLYISLHMHSSCCPQSSAYMMFLPCVILLILPLTALVVQYFLLVRISRGVGWGGSIAPFPWILVILSCYIALFGAPQSPSSSPGLTLQNLLCWTSQKVHTTTEYRSLESQECP